MTAALIGLGISSVSVFLLALLFRIERARGVRMLSSLRDQFDRTMERMFMSFSHGSRYFGRDAVRQSIHFGVHLVLRVIERAISFVLKQIGRLQRTNRVLAHRATKSDAVTPRTKLEELQEHKEEVALTPRERKAHKEESIGMRL